MMSDVQNLSLGRYIKIFVFGDDDDDEDVRDRLSALLTTLIRFSCEVKISVLTLIVFDD